MEILGTILIAIIPSTIAAIITNYLNKKKYIAEAVKIEKEATKIENEADTIQNSNLQIIFDTYNSMLETNKLEIENMKKRIFDLIAESEKRDSEYKKRIEKLSNKINILMKDTCLTKGCSERSLWTEQINK